MTLTVRSATVNGATTKGSALSHAETDENWNHVANFTPSGSGAVARTVQAKAREWLSVEDFGAVGDGSTDDTAAFTAALAEQASSGKKLMLKSKVYKANISITGQRVHIEADNWAYNGTSSVGIVPATLTSPVISIGDGTTLTRDVTINGVSLWGNNTGDKGLLINGANDVYLNGFTARGFEEYATRITSSATRSSFFIFFNGYHLETGTTAGALGLDVIYGSSFTTAIYLHNGAFNSGGGSASFNIQISGSGASMSLSNTWIEAGDDRGINFATTGTKIDCANVTIDSSSSADSLITLPENAVISSYLRGTFVADGVCTMTGGDTASLAGRMHFPDRSFYNNPNVIGQINFQNASGGANAWDRYATALQAQNITRSGTILRLNSTDGSVEKVIPSTGSEALVSTTNGQRITTAFAATEVTAMSGATVTATNLIPAGSIVLGVTCRVTTLITGATSFSVGDGADADRWGTGIAVAAGTTTTNANTTITSVPVYAAATSVVLTAAGGNFSAGAVRITVHYIGLTAATS